MENKIGCTFGCHRVDDKGNDDPSTPFTEARRFGLTLRIDEVAKAMASRIDDTAGQKRSPGQIRFGVYTFGRSWKDKGFYTVSPLTADLASVKNKTSKITVMTLPERRPIQRDFGVSDYELALTKLGKEIKGPVGSGTSATDRKKIVFLVGDGTSVSERPQSGCTPQTPYTKCSQPIDVKYCQALKDRGIVIAVLYTPYLRDLNGYPGYIDPLEKQASENMRDCATTGLFILGVNAIDDEMKRLFPLATRSPRLLH